MTRPHSSGSDVHATVPADPASPAGQPEHLHWFQAFDGVDLSFPIVWTRNVSGRSRVYVGWVENGGSIDLGVTAKYLTKWKAGLNYHHFTGKHGTDIGVASFDQTAWDRDYVSFNLSTTF